MPNAVVNALMPPPQNPAQPPKGFWGNAGSMAYDTLGLGDVAKALRGQMTANEAQDFAFGAAAGLLPIGRGVKAATGAAEKIISATYKVGDQVFQAPNHFDAAEMAVKGLGLKNMNELMRHGARADAEGFMTSTGRVVSREEANQIAQAAEQGATKNFLGKIRAEEISLPPQGIRAYHGSPHDFDRFDMSRIGTGEGAQAYGHGLYFAENPAVAADYKSKLSTLANVNQSALDSNALYYLQRNKFDKAAARAELEDALRTKLPDSHPSIQAINSYNPGKMYEVNINAHPDQFLDWDKPLAKQGPDVQQAINKILPPGLDKIRGEQLYRTDLPYHLGVTKPEVSGALGEAGIPGIKYLDQGSRTAGDGSRNYVVFDDKLIDIVKKYGLAALGLLPALAGGQEPQVQAQ
jgi:hypothetical protein